MNKTINAEDLNQIWIRWNQYRKAEDIEEEIWRLGQKLIANISEMVFLLENFNKKTASSYGKMIAAVVTRAFTYCYYIGYELASQRMTNKEASNYLLAATEPIDKFVLDLLAVLVVKDLIEKDKGESMVLRIAILTVETANNICVLGIKSFVPPNLVDILTKKCSNCGNMINEKSIICGNCGELVNNDHNK